MNVSVKHCDYVFQITRGGTVSGVRRSRGEFLPVSLAASDAAIERLTSERSATLSEPAMLDRDSASEDVESHARSTGRGATATEVVPDPVRRCTEGGR